jgi:uncharacterized membrane-anchored protein
MNEPPSGIARLHRIAQGALLVLSVLALLTVVTGFLQPPQADEGTAAHIFQLSVVIFGFMLTVYFATADWKQPRGESRRLAVPAAAISAAFVALYCLEHLR